MYHKKHKNNLFSKIRYTKIILILLLILISFFLGAYAHKTHFFYTFIKPLIFQNLNYLKKSLQGKIHKVDKVYLEIDFETLKKLNNRKETFIKNEFIDQNLNQWLSVSINYNNKNYESKIRFKGRMVDTHLNPTMRNKNISYKVKIKKNEIGNILGMRQFSLMDLRRRGYLLEWYAREFLKNEKLIHLNYKFINLFINGEDHGIYVMDEAISESTLTRNNRRDSVSIRIDNNFINARNDLSITNPNGYAGYNDNFIIGEIDTLNETIGNKYKELSNLNTFSQNYPISIEDKIILGPDSGRLKKLNVSSKLLNDFRDGLLKTEEVFDVDQLAKGFAASDILDGWHGVNWTNMSFYFNPITLKLEPIFQDWYNEGFISKGNERVKRDIRLLDIYNYGIFYRNIFSSEIFLKKYIGYLERYSSDNYFLNFNKNIEKDFNNNLKSIYKSSPYYEFPHEMFERKIKKIKDFIYHYDPVYLSLVSGSREMDKKNITVLKFGNKHVLPINVKKIKFESLEGKIFQKNIDFKLEPRELKNFNNYKFENSPIKFQLLELASPNFQKFKNISVEFQIDGSDKIMTKEITNPIESTKLNKSNFDNFLISGINKSNLDTSKFINKIDDEYIFKSGKWIIYDDLIVPENMKLVIPPGTELILTNNAKIISKSPIIAKGNFEDKVVFKSLTKDIIKKINKKDWKKLNIDINDITTGQCISIFGTEEMSIFEHVIFDNLRNCETQVFDTEGSFNVYESKIKMNHVEFKNNKLGDDGINIIKSDFDLENIKLTNIHSDGLDLDYSQGTIKNFSCIKCLNDGIDISNTTLILENYYASNISDKALSVGELSTLFAKKFI